MSIDAEALARLRSLLAKFPVPWTAEESYTDSGGRYIGIESSAHCVFEDVAGQGCMSEDAAELIVAAVNALPALLDIAETVQWQPIETAPKDGTAILVCYAPQYDTNGFLPVAVRWRNYHPNAQGKEAFRQSNGNKVEVVTHWMPLPKPPVVVPCTGGGE